MENIPEEEFNTITNEDHYRCNHCGNDIATDDIGFNYIEDEEMCPKCGSFDIDYIF